MFWKSDYVEEKSTKIEKTTKIENVIKGRQNPQKSENHKKLAKKCAKLRKT